MNTNDTVYLPANQSVVKGLLLYENPLGNVTALVGVQYWCAKFNESCFDKNSEHFWLDISKNDKSVPQSVFSPQYYNYSEPDDDNVVGVSSTLYESSPETIFSTPFASGPYESSDFRINVLICASNSQTTGKVDNSGCNSLINTVYDPWTNASHGALITDGSMYSQLSDANTEITSLSGFQQYQPSNFSGIKDSDLVLASPLQFAVWVRGTEPIILNNYGVETPAPNVSFPFRRLAGVTSSDQAAYFLYHQIDGTTFAEEQFDASSSDWLPSSNITIPDLT